MASKRLYLRAGEVATLFGEDSSRSEWQLWRDMTDGADAGPGEFGRWQARLAVPIMQGVCEDHRLKIDRSVSPADCGEACKIMPPRAWLLKPNMTTEGRPAVLVVQQKTGGSMREWKAPAQLPAKHMRRYLAVATAYGIDDVIVGVLEDGYASHLFHIRATQEQRDEIAMRVADFVALVDAGEEPDLDFSADAGAVRKGVAIARTEASTEQVETILAERATLLSRQQPIEVSLKQIVQRLTAIDTMLIHMAGKDGRLEVGTRLVAVSRNARGVPKVEVIDKAAAPLF